MVGLFARLLLQMANLVASLLFKLVDMRAAALFKLTNPRMVLMLAHRHSTFQPVNGTLKARKGACDIGHGFPRLQISTAGPKLPEPACLRI